MPSRSAYGAVIALALAVGAGAEDSAGDRPIDDLLAPWWPRMSDSLPTGFAVLGGGVAGAGAEVGAWAGGLHHPNPRWSWGMAVGASFTSTGLGGPFPNQVVSGTAVVGGWRRFGLDDHLVLLAIPGASRADVGPAGVGGTALAAWIHRGGRSTWWLFGTLATTTTDSSPLALPLVGLFAARGRWDLLLTPVYSSAVCHITQVADIGAWAGIAGWSAPIDGGGHVATWQGRGAVRGRWSPAPHWQLVIDAGLVLGGWASRDGPADDDLVRRRVPPGPLLLTSLAVSW